MVQEHMVQENVVPDLQEKERHKSSSNNQDTGLTAAHNKAE